MATPAGSLAIGLATTGFVENHGKVPDLTHQNVGAGHGSVGAQDHGVTQYYDTSSGEHITLVGGGYASGTFQIKSGASITELDSGKNIDVYGSNAADKIIILDDASHDVKSGIGNDFIQNLGSGTGVLSGGAGQDVIIGGAGNEFINGGTGNDVMTGNGGQDVFLFDKEVTGNDVITDFSKGDVIDISARGAQDGKVEEGRDYSITQDGADTVITLHDNGDTIVLKNVDSQTLESQKDDGIFTLD